jgi:hypothetical protein
MRLTSEGFFVRKTFILRGFCLAGAFAAMTCAAPIEFVRVAGTIAGGIGGGGNTLTYSSLTGLTSQGTALPPSSITQTYSPNATLLNQTAAWVAVEGTLVNGGQTYDPTALASADLSTGKLGVLGGASMISGSGTAVNGLGSASATMRDEVTFMNTTGATVPIDVYYTLAGSIISGTGGSIGETLRFCLGPACALAGNSLIDPTFEYMFFENSAFLPDGNYVRMPISGWQSTTFTPGNDPTSGVFHGVYLLPAGESTVDLFARMTIDCRFNALCDFSHTGTLAFNLSPGITFTSASGVLLQASGPSPVPEPGSLAMLALGAVVVAARARRGGLVKPAK